MAPAHRLAVELSDQTGVFRGLSNQSQMALEKRGLNQKITAKRFSATSVAAYDGRCPWTSCLPERAILRGHSIEVPGEGQGRNNNPFLANWLPPQDLAFSATGRSKMRSGFLERRLTARLAAVAAWPREMPIQDSSFSCASWRG
jgi:hypothetical protein